MLIWDTLLSDRKGVKLGTVSHYTTPPSTSAPVHLPLYWENCFVWCKIGRGGSRIQWGSNSEHVNEKPYANSFLFQLTKEALSFFMQKILFPHDQTSIVFLLSIRLDYLSFLFHTLHTYTQERYRNPFPQPLKNLVSSYKKSRDTNITPVNYRHPGFQLCSTSHRICT